MEIGEEIVVHKGKYKYVSRKMRKSLEKYLKNQKKNKEGFWEQRFEICLDLLEHLKGDKG